jgi:hypothetical protein
MPNKDPELALSHLKVVLVHLGDSPATHLWENLRSLLSRFPNIEFVLVSDREHSQAPKNPRLTFFQYCRDQETQNTLEGLAHDSKFRSGFWQLTLERFIALEKYHAFNPSSKIIHIESDILLLPNFPFEAFNTLPKLAWQRVDDTRDIASILVLPSFHETAWFINEMLKLLHNDNSLTDMTLLNSLRVGNPKRINILPSFSIELDAELHWNGELNGKLASELSSDEEFFNGIFDPAAFGMWLGGSDPRNYYGRQILFDTSEILSGGTYVNPARYKYIFNKQQLFCIGKHSQTRIWSLHVHSKDLRLLGEDWQERLTLLVELSDLRHKIIEFQFKSLVKLAISNLRNRTFVSWILHIPKLKPILAIIRRLRSMIWPMRK